MTASALNFYRKRDYEKYVSWQPFQLELKKNLSSYKAFVTWQKKSPYFNCEQRGDFFFHNVTS